MRLPVGRRGSIGASLLGAAGPPPSRSEGPGSGSAASWGENVPSAPPISNAPHKWRADPGFTANRNLTLPGSARLYSRKEALSGVGFRSLGFGLILRGPSTGSAF